MKVYNDKIEDIGQVMISFLNDYRHKRGFDAKTYIENKKEIINAYFKESKLTHAVVAVSGGIDSAIVLGLLKETLSMEGSFLKEIVAITLPAKTNSGVTGQITSEERAIEVCHALGVKAHSVDLSIHSKHISDDIESVLSIEANDWAKGQLVPYLRTSMLYYFTTLLTQENKKAVLVGTTNADEGQYLGYIGKASDGMVDIQPISDLHKSEVYLVAKELNIPESIINIKPTGDMYDNRTDEEVFGASYNFVEAYYAYLKCDEAKKEELMMSLHDANEMPLFERLSGNLEKMHAYNKHKYLGCSPAVHFDIYDMKIKGGWKYFVWEACNEK